MCNAHDDVSEFEKESALEWLGEKVGNHNAGGAIQEVDVTIGNLVLNEEVLDVYVPGFLSGRRTNNRSFPSA
jgi:hypothetical protein